MTLDREDIVKAARAFVDDGPVPISCGGSYDRDEEGGDENLWLLEAELLINSGLNLQSMDVAMGRRMERDLGPLSIAEKNAVIAEFHRQVLELLGLPVPQRGLDPDPLELSVIHLPSPYSWSGEHGSELHRFTDAEIAELHALVERERPELIAHVVADLQRWVAEGRPRDPWRARSGFAMGAMSHLIRHTQPDLEDREADRAVSGIIVRINEPYL